MRPPDDAADALLAAAVRDVFDPAALTVPGFDLGRLMTSLMPYVDTTIDHEGRARWSLHADVRAEVLARTTGAGARRWIEAGGPVIQTERQKVFGRWLHAQLDVDQAPTAAVRAVATWLRDAAWVEPRAGEVLAQIARRELGERLRSSAGLKFCGRAAELAELGAVIDRTAAHPLLCLEATGGMGKSALISEALLRRGAGGPDAKVLFAFLDFDSSTIDPFDPASIVAGILEQLAPQLGGLDGQRKSLDQIIAGGRSLYQEEGVAAQRIGEDSRLWAFLNMLSRHFAERHGNRPLVVILDTLERALHKAGRMVGTTISVLWNQLLAPLDGTSLVLAGRTVPDELWPVAGKRIALGPLDPAGATEMLASLGVPERRAKRAATIIGGVPLTLRLAARVLAAESDAPLDDPHLLEAVQRARINGYLFRRVLTHLPDERLAKLAESGLLLRDLSARAIVALLADAVAPPVESLDAAGAMIDDLARMEDLFVVTATAEGPSLRVRPEIRRDLLELLREADPDRVRALHERAATHFASLGTVAGQGAAAYHLLQLGQTSAARDLMSDEIAEKLGDALDELPAAAVTWMREQGWRASQAQARGIGDGDEPPDRTVAEAMTAADVLMRQGRFAEALARLLEVDNPLDDERWDDRVVDLARRAGDTDAVRKILSSRALAPFTAAVACDVAQVPIEQELATRVLAEARGHTPLDPPAIRALLILLRTPWAEAHDARAMLQQSREPGRVYSLHKSDRDLMRRYVAEVGSLDELQQALEYKVLNEDVDLTGLLAALEQLSPESASLVNRSRKRGLSRALKQVLERWPVAEPFVRELLIKSMEHAPPPMPAMDRSRSLEQVVDWIATNYSSPSALERLVKQASAEASDIFFGGAAAETAFQIVTQLDRRASLPELFDVLRLDRPDAEAQLAPAFTALGKITRKS